LTVSEPTTYNGFIRPLCRFSAPIGGLPQKPVATNSLSKITLRSSKSPMLAAIMSGTFISKPRILAIALGVCTLFSTAAFAQAGPKVGIVSIQDAITATNEGQKEAAALQARFGGRQNALKAQNDEIVALQSDLQAKGDKLNDEERASRVKAITDKQKILQRNGEDFQAEVTAAEQEVVNRLGKKMLEILDKYAKDNGFTVVLDVSNPQSPVLWASQTTNITKDLVDAYNAASGVAAQPRPTAPSGTQARPATAPAKKP
jgi:Skp family chaperone for outer membrane proteins